MNLDILQYFDLGFEVSIMSYFQEVAEHFYPKLVGRVWFKHNRSDIVSKRINHFNEMSGCGSFLHD
jgi:hypothetical protein